MPTTAEYLAAQPNVMQDMSQGSDYVNKLYARSAQVQAGQQYAAGNSPAAQSTLASSGDIAGAQQLHNDTVQNFQTQHAYVARAAPVLQAAYDKYSSNGTNPDAGKVAALFTFDQMAPELQQIGVPADNLLKIRSGLQTNTPETLQGIGAFAAVKPQFEKTGDTTGILIDQNSGRILAQVQGDKIVDAPPQNQVLRYGGASDPSGSGAAMPAPQAAGAPVQPPPGAPAPIAQGQGGVLPSVNPAAVAQVESRGDPNAVSPVGATGTMQTMPGTLANPGYGVAPAANNSPQEQTRVGQDYVGAMTQKYGPAIGLVAYNMGPGATDKWLASGGDFAKLPDETQKYIGRVAIQEAMSRRQPQPSAPAPAAAQPQPQAGLAPGVQVLKPATQEWRDATPDERVQGVNQVNTATGKKEMEPQSLIPPDPKNVAAIAHAIANYQQPMPQSYGRTSPFAQALTAAVYQQNPDYDAKNYAKYQQGYKAFSTGTQGNTVRSLNVFVQHGQVLQQAAQALQNGNTPLFNKISNWWATQTGNPLPSNFNAVRNVYAEEATKAILGGAGALGDREEVRNTINSAQSPQQLAGVANSFNNLAAGQLSGLGRQYQNGTGRKDFNTLLDPSTVQTLARHQATGGSGSPKIRTYNPQTGKLE